jgi:hypothetical protein
MVKIDQITKSLSVQDQYQESLLILSNVVGVGTGYRMRGGEITEEICVQVLVDRKIPIEMLAPHDLVPTTLEVTDGYRVKTDVLEVSPIDAQQDIGRYRPVPAGVSIGAENRINAGTLGGWACDNDDDTTVLLSNNHVISNLDTMPVLRRIVQPGRFDGGILPADIIGQLKRDVTVNTVPNVIGANPPTSIVDAAIGSIDVQYTHNLRQLNVPVIYEIQAPSLGMDVQKRGRTTRLTNNGRITTVNVTQLITYRNRTRLGRIQNCFIITSTDGNLFSNSGDSGSLILNQVPGEINGTFPIVGLLFAGGTNPMGTPITIANDINAVIGALNLSTVCTCVARAIIRAIFGAELIESRDISRFLYFKERQLKYLRYSIFREGRFGELIENQIKAESARVGQIIAEDDEAFGLLVKALRPLVKKPTNYEILKTKLDRDTLDNLMKFSGYISRRSRDLKPTISLAQEILKELEGQTIEQVIRSADLKMD